jgi:hypothetical protein
MTSRIPDLGKALTIPSVGLASHLPWQVVAAGLLLSCGWWLWMRYEDAMTYRAIRRAERLNLRGSGGNES